MELHKTDGIILYRAKRKDRITKNNVARLKQDYENRWD
jgi:uncharacterized protein YihD (DUF1040 family)